VFVEENTVPEESIMHCVCGRKSCNVLVSQRFGGTMKIPVYYCVGGTMKIL